MSKKAPTLLDVHGQADDRSIFLGQVSQDPRSGLAGFQWSEQALSEGVEWSPIRLPLDQKLWLSGIDERNLMGLPGLLHDALPDGWGLLLMDRAFQQQGIPKESVTPLLRLALLSDRSWGALSFKPQWGTDVPTPHRSAIAALAEESQQILQGQTEIVSQALLVAGGSPHGARPKIMVGVNEDASHALVGHNELPEGYRHVLIKFAGHRDAPTSPLLEYCYTQAARAYGIGTMPACTVQAGNLIGLCVDRFDRQNHQRQHVHSMAGMLHVNHQIANCDWLQVAQILKKLDGGRADLHQAFRRAIFNAVFVARDDHTKNIAFLRRADGSWGLSPAFDIAFSTGPGGWHTLSYASNAEQWITMRDLLAMAPHFEIETADVSQMVAHAQDARTQMLTQAKGMGVEKSLLREIREHFKPVDLAIVRKNRRLQRPK